ncbi:toll/interleukin-1 receptor domain-containing protein [Vitreimonas flagellata]|uniref:toll/interleukin-1 receptor domain-containing protein n=1 Tax=Vitreimonas flagellata TaxID=2560861 RepID=UPI0010752BD4|nr:toll/interleukin-1 receptor domain-containing protein [Vitreimonas flagellata]
MSKPAKRFRAFISYSQRDKSIAKRVHKALETYRLPGGVQAEGVDRSRRIGRVFRDDEEMGASPDLGATLRGALEDTEALIVICSRRSAKSKWVNQEIAHFKRTGRADRIFAVIVDGAPDARHDRDQCFAPALRFEVDANGAVTDRPSEPLGLDLREQSFERLRVRLIAGLLNVAFDDLWNRDRRRRRVNNVIAAATVLFTLGLVGAMGAFWLNERVERTLVEARADIGEGRVSQALERLRPFEVWPNSAVEPTLRSVLGWARPIGEQVEAQGRPRLILYRGAVLILDPGGHLHDVSEIGGAPQRVLLARDQRRLVVIGESRTLVIDVATGAKLAEAENNGTTWGSYAFETPQGRLVILGVRPGSTLGSISYGAMTVSADGASAQRLDLMQRVGLESVWLDGACNGLFLGVRDAGAIGLPLVANGALSPIAYEATPIAQMLSATQVWRIESNAAGSPYEGNPFEAEAADLQAVNLFAEIGCHDLAADTGAEDLDPAIVVPVRLGVLSASGEGWQGIAAPPEQFRRMATPATEDGDGELRFWRSLPTPGGIAPETAAFDAVSGETLAFIEDRGNAGVRWAACRTNGQCAEVVSMHDGRRRYDLARSPDGRFLVVALGGGLIDLERLEVVSRELPTQQGTAYDFEPDQTQLTFVDEGDLVAYRPSAGGARWTRVEEISNAALLRGDVGFAGLVAFGAGEYLVVRENGAAVRFAGDGRALWQITYAGLGTVFGVRYSTDRRYVALIGASGLRLINSDTGLALSGLLRPPGWPAEESEAANCVSSVHVSNGGDLRLICASYPQAVAATWSPRPFTGDLATRTNALTCDANAGLSAVAALRRCLGR